jgi:ribosomal protein S11
VAKRKPVDYGPEVTAVICERLALGESLRSICRDAAMPSMAAVMNWLNREPAFVEQYVRARELQAEYLVDEIIEIADDATNDYMQKLDRDGKQIGWRENGEFLNRSRLRIDARKWAAGKMAPKKYGEKVEIDQTSQNKTEIVIRGGLPARDAGAEEAERAS